MRSSDLLLSTANAGPEIKEIKAEPGRHRTVCILRACPCVAEELCLVGEENDRHGHVVLAGDSGDLAIQAIQLFRHQFGRGSSTRSPL